MSVWLSVDPLASGYSSTSPFMYCLGNPIVLIDPDGMSESPIFDVQGNLLGTDNEGLQGKAIIMKREDFTQGMNHYEALRKNIGGTGLEDDAAKEKFLKTFFSLPNRPDWDGGLTKEEADAWWQKGTGEPLFVDESKIALPDVSTENFDSEGYYSRNFIWGLSETGKVYGTLDMTLIDNKTGAVRLGYRNPDASPNGYVMDRYDFEYDGRFLRDVATWYGKPSGSGKAFDIHGYGVARVIVKQ